MIEVTLSPQRLQAGQDTEVTVTLTNVGEGVCRNVVFHLDLPWQIIRLSGNGQIETDRLPAGASVRGSLRVRADDVGSWPVHSSNFSYRNRHGSTVRKDDYTDLLIVEPVVRVEAPPPRLKVEVAEGILEPDRWGAFRIRLSNIGDTAVRDVSMVVRGPLRFDDARPRWLPSLLPGDSVDFPFDVLPNETGSVPVHVELTGGYGQQDQTVRLQWAKKVSVGSAAVRPAGPSAVLYVSANPVQTQLTHAAAEAREIRRELAVNPAFRLEERGAIGPRELTGALHDLHPRIVHLAAHGAEGYLYLEREKGHPHPVTPRAVAGLFSETTDYVECVIAGACDSEPLAQEVRRHVDYVIAVNDRLPSDVAIAFSVGFYQALAAGEPIEKAYRFGSKQVHLELGDDFEDYPVRLYTRAGGAHAGSR